MHLIHRLIRSHSFPTDCSYEKCDPNDPNNWWLLPQPSVEEGIAYSASPEASTADAAMSTSKGTEDSFGTNNQVSMAGRTGVAFCLLLSLTTFARDRWRAWMKPILSSQMEVRLEQFIFIFMT